MSAATQQMSQAHRTAPHLELDVVEGESGSADLGREKLAAQRTNRGLHEPD